MKSLLKNLVKSFSKKNTARPAKSRQHYRPSIEGLEQRDVPTTFSAVANVVASNVLHDALKLVQDAATIEIAKPTLLKTQIVSDLQVLYNAANRRSFGDVFAGESRLLNDVALELKSSAASTSHPISLWNYAAIQNDFTAAAQDKQDVIQLVAIASQQSRPTTTSAPQFTMAQFMALDQIAKQSQATQNQLNRYVNPTTLTGNNSSVAAIDAWAKKFDSDHGYQNSKGMSGGHHFTVYENGIPHVYYW
jgi:hypothetical protein